MVLIVFNFIRLFEVLCQAGQILAANVAICAL